MNPNKTLTIHWTRHAESCSNLETGYNMDKDEYPNREIGYSQIDVQKTKKETNKFYDFLKSLNMYSQCSYHPNLSFIGMQQSILLGEFVKDYDIICVSPMLRTIMTALLSLRGKKCIIYVVPYIVEDTNPLCMGNDKQNNPLGYEQLEKTVIFVKDWLEKNWIKNFDDIKLMNNILDIKKLLPNKAELINTILKCRVNKDCAMLHNIKLLTKYVATGHNSDKINKIINEIKLICEVEYIRGPIVDFSVLKYFETNKYDLAQSFDKFFSNVIPYIIKANNIQKSDLKILCVSHGNSITNYFKNKYGVSNGHPFNTETYEEVIKCSDYKNILDRKFNGSIYKPIKIRTNYENFESINGNVCAVDGLKGVVNYNGEKCDFHKDVDFFCKDKSKYIQYKKKYIQIKSN